MSEARFSFRRFVQVLGRSLEVAVMVALIFNAVASVPWRYGSGNASARTILDDSSKFTCFAILSLLLADVVRIVLRDRGAIFATFRVLIYLVIFGLIPHPLGSLQNVGPNHSMKRIAAGMKTGFCMTKTFGPSSASPSAAIRLSLSR